MSTSCKELSSDFNTNYIINLSKKEAENIIDKLIQNGKITPKELVILALSYEKIDDELDDDDKMFYRCLIG